MRYGAMNFPIRPVIDEIHAIGALGFDYVELAMDAPHGHYSSLEEQRDGILSALQQYGMELLCHLPTFIHTADLTPGIREASLTELLNALRVAQDLGASKAVLHPSFVGGLAGHTPQRVWHYTLDAMDAVMHQAEKTAFRICLENLFDRLTPFTRPDDFAVYFDRWPQMAMTLDVGHAFIDSRGMTRMHEFIHRFGERIRHVHISDNFGQRDDHLAVGDGAIDFHGLMVALGTIGYDGTMTLEIFSQDRNDLVRSRSALEAMSGM
jgi:sugar phosphate isomerase/epimerase